MPLTGRFSRLDAVYVDRIRPFRAVCNFKRNFVAYLEVIERNVLELIRVEKEIFLSVSARNESKAAVSDSSNCSFHDAKWLMKYRIGFNMDIQKPVLVKCGMHRAKLDTIFPMHLT